MSIEKAIARAWADPAYRDRLLNDTHAALADVGIEVPESHTIKVIEDQPGSVHLVLPAPPKNADQLSLDELENAVGAGFTDGMGCTPTCP